MRRWCIGLLFLSACDYDSWDDFYDFPDGTIVKQADTTEAQDKWYAANLPDISACPAITEVLPDYQLFAEVCGGLSCNDPVWKASGTQSCVYACARHIEDGVPVMFYAEAIDKEIPGHGEAEEVVHEVFHTWSFCVYGDSDPQHKRIQLWR